MLLDLEISKNLKMLKFVERLSSDLAQNVYDEKDRAFLDIIWPLIDLKFLAMRIKEKGS